MAADFGLFIGWGTVKPGREEQALALFQEAQQFDEKLKQRGEIESFETVLLEVHGGDLGGFTLLRGTADKLNRIRYQDQEFLSLINRAILMLNDVGVVGAWIGEGINKQIPLYMQAIRSLQPTAGVR
jgi:hypothetical protein